MLENSLKKVAAGREKCPNCLSTFFFFLKVSKIIGSLMKGANVMQTSENLRLTKHKGGITPY